MKYEITERQITNGRRVALTNMRANSIVRPMNRGRREAAAGRRNDGAANIEGS